MFCTCLCTFRLLSPPVTITFQNICHELRPACTTPSSGFDVPFFSSFLPFLVNRVVLAYNNNTGPDLTALKRGVAPRRATVWFCGVKSTCGKFWDACPNFLLDASDKLEVQTWFVGDGVSLTLPPAPQKGPNLGQADPPERNKVSRAVASFLDPCEVGSAKD